MASPDDQVEQQLATRHITPIAQLSPNLADQATRKVHGEVTITWPYSSVTNSFAFLLAEPDFRLRRDKGSVRVHLTGPSAEAASKWDLGSGDEVILALDGVDWAKDEEPARPAGSRIDWQLKFAGRLLTKVILNEGEQTHLVNIDQAIAVESPPQAIDTLPTEEIDIAAVEEEIAASKLVTRDLPQEFSSPVFSKRARASYGPLFDLDNDDDDDDELFVDGGRRGKGRKRPRYSVQNRMWKYREDSSSPEPEQVQEPASPVQTRGSNVGMQNAHAHVDMTDEQVQTNEDELPPAPPSSAFDTPIKKWSQAEMSPSLRLKTSQPIEAAEITLDARATPAKPQSSVPRDHPEDKTTVQTPKNPFAASNNRWEVEMDTSIEAAPDTPSGPKTPVTTQPAKSASPAQTTPSRSIPSGSGPPLETGAVHTPQPVDVVPDSADISTRLFGQTSPLFGTGPAPLPPAFAQNTQGSAFGVPVGSLRFGFGFGQAPLPPADSNPFVSSHTPEKPVETNPYPENYLDQREPSTAQPTASQHNHDMTAQDAHPQHDSEPLAMQGASFQGHHQDHSVPLWPLGSQHYDDSHIVGRIDPAEDLRSEYNVSEPTPPGIIPPEVEDGTRNMDEMKQQGLLATPVYQQGVPPEAIPGQEEIMAEEDGSLDSDEEADYDEDEKGDDYDLRNYDRISDDEEAYDDEDNDLLSDDELLDEDEQPFYGGDRGYDHNDYDEQNYEQDAAQNYFSRSSHYQQRPLAQPAVQKEPIVIDLLSDSDDEPPPPSPKQAPQTQTLQHQTSQPFKTEDEPEVKDRSRSIAISSPLAQSASQQQDADSQDEENSLGESDEELDDPEELEEEDDSVLYDDSEVAEGSIDAEGSEDVEGAADAQEDGDAEFDVDEADSGGYQTKDDPRLTRNLDETTGTPLRDAASAEKTSAVTNTQIDVTSDAIVEQVAEKKPRDELTAPDLKEPTHRRSSDARDLMEVDGEDLAEEEPQHQVKEVVKDQQADKPPSDADDAMILDMSEQNDSLQAFQSQVVTNIDAEHLLSQDSMLEVDPGENSIAEETQKKPASKNVPVSSPEAEATQPITEGSLAQPQGQVAVEPSKESEVLEITRQEKIQTSLVAEQVPMLEPDATQPDAAYSPVQRQEDLANEPSNSTQVPVAEATVEAQEKQEQPEDISEPLADESTVAAPFPIVKSLDHEVEIQSEVEVTVKKVTERIETQIDEQVEASVEIQRTDIMITQEVMPEEVQGGDEDQDVQMLDSENIAAELGDRTAGSEAQDLGVHDVVASSSGEEGEEEPDEEGLQEEAAAEEQMADEQTVEEQPVELQPVGEHPDKEQIIEQQMVEERPVEEDSSDRPSAAVKPKEAGRPDQQAVEAGIEPVQDMDIDNDEVVDQTATDEGLVDEGKAFNEAHDQRTQSTRDKTASLNQAENFPYTEFEPVAEHTAGLQATVDKSQEMEPEPASVDRQPLVQIDGNISGDEKGTRESSEQADTHRSMSISVDASFKSAASQASDAAETDDIESIASSRPKRGRKPRVASTPKAPKSTPASKRGQRQISFDQGPGTQRTTRSKAMSFQKSSSVPDEKQDMSILLARAAVKSPSKTQRKASTTTLSKRSNSKTDWTVRLDNDMPDCAALKDLRKYNSRTVRLDVAVVVTSAHTPPKRTSTREYASSFTVTDPSVAPDSVIEVSLYSLHRDYLPIVKRGDSVILRSFTVESLPGRGFGLRTEKDESSWAVFKADGADDEEPEMRAAPVELNAKETKYLLDLRGWFAELSEDAKSQLNEAVEEAVQSGRQSREKN
ncbi:hypothetical protein BD289DRAFT_145394 [Coniella lustricola]|uniref:Telomeric single stranded DNA binding POT1/Cdc13 domain-containing protein n=1 Tax=Coniella lustricola TaxID=2025994 RepID=A0A2T3AF33_9PEZI|nr:hypothetical protein BD289DRAFT_145394 [Coniella lustricola]